MSIFDKLKGLFSATSTNGEASGSERRADVPDMVSCEEALSLVHEYLDGELDTLPEAQVRQHFDVCERCYPHLRFESSFRETVRRAASGQSAPPELRAKVIRLLAEAKADS